MIRYMRAQGQQMAEPRHKQVDEEHERVKFQLALQGLSLAEIARRAGVSPTMVTAVSRGRRRNAAVEQLIADVLDQPPTDLWPTRHGRSMQALTIPDFDAARIGEVLAHSAAGRDQEERK